MENAKKFRSLGKFERHVACTDLIFGRVKVQRFYYVIHCSGAVFQPPAPSFRSVGMKKVPLHGVTLDDALHWSAGWLSLEAARSAGLVGPKVSDQRATSWRARREFHGSSTRINRASEN
ncbi:MAG: hypothetical protein Q9205_001457 [Flavoplaca limonia]